ncbi:MAG: PIN domain-containing protein [Thermodesulfobacteriota bacterium]
MNGSFLLDTNIIIALFAQDYSVREYLLEAQEIFIPNVALGELYYGARKSSHV